MKADVLSCFYNTNTVASLGSQFFVDQEEPPELSVHLWQLLIVDNVCYSI